jgi:hypothetical protein
MAQNFVLGGTAGVGQDTCKMGEIFFEVIEIFEKLDNAG